MQVRGQLPDKFHAQASQRHDKVRVQTTIGTQVWRCAAPLETASHAVSAAEQEITPPAQGHVAEQPAAETWPYVSSPHRHYAQSNLLSCPVRQTQHGGSHGKNPDPRPIYTEEGSLSSSVTQCAKQCCCSTKRQQKQGKTQTQAARHSAHLLPTEAILCNFSVALVAGAFFAQDAHGGVPRPCQYRQQVGVNDVHKGPLPTYTMPCCWLGVNGKANQPAARTHTA